MDSTHEQIDYWQSLIRFLRVEALCRFGVGDDGVVEVMKGNARNSSLRLPKQNPNWDSTSLITGTSLTHQLAVSDLLHAERTGDEETRTGDKETTGGHKETSRWRQGDEETSRRKYESFRLSLIEAAKESQRTRKKVH